MHLLVLAFETPSDLPHNWEEFEHITAYGPAKDFAFDEKFSVKKLHIMRKLFSIRDLQKPTQPFNACYIKHPDPWGEPRNWIKAIAALGETLQGSLTCEFWFTHEVPAFHQLLLQTLGEEHVTLQEVGELEKIGNKPNYYGRWGINTVGILGDMFDKYERQKTAILEEHYNKAGEYFHAGMSLEEAKSKLPDA